MVYKETIIAVIENSSTVSNIHKLVVRYATLDAGPFNVTIR